MPAFAAVPKSEEFSVWRSTGAEVNAVQGDDFGGDVDSLADSKCREQGNYKELSAGHFLGMNRKRCILTYL